LKPTQALANYILASVQLSQYDIDLKETTKSFTLLPRFCSQTQPSKESNLDLIDLNLCKKEAYSMFTFTL